MTTLAASPRYAKFFRMLRVGLPEGAVRQLLRAQGLDERALALGPDALERDLAAPVPTGPAVDTRVYETSLRMLLVGVPQGAVEAALRVRSLDARAFEQTLGKLRATLARRHQPLQVESVSFPSGQANGVDTTTLEDATTQDATTAVMARVGVPEGAVRQRQEVQRRAEAASLASPWTNLFATAPDDPTDATPLAQHAPLRRFFEMLRAGVAVGAVENALAAARLPRELAHWDPALPVGALAGEPA